MIYCIEVDRSGLPEEPVVLHHGFHISPTREDIIRVLKDADIGYDEDYCKFEYYQIS